MRMIKPQNKAIGVIVILSMLGTSPLSVTYSFAEIEDNQEDKRKQDDDPNTENSRKKGESRTILTEKIINGKLKLQHYVLPNDIIESDMHRILSFEGQISSWAYVNYKAYQSGIILFDGKASKIEGDFWDISTSNVLSIEESHFGMESDGKLNDSRLVMHETASSEDLNYQIIFSGKVAEIYEESALLIYLVNWGLNYKMDQNIKLSDSVGMTVNSEKLINFNQEFGNSIWVI